VRGDRGVGDGWRFASIKLKEPTKANLPAPEDCLLAGREPLAACCNRADGQAYRATVSVAGNEITNWKHLPAQEPNITVDEWHECDEMLRAHPALAQALNPTGTTIM
jgi:primary-amine oxidase